MKRRSVLTLLLLLAASVLAGFCFAASPQQTQCADALHELGLFDGSGKNADGTPIYSLDRAPTRAEAITMLIRLLGKEEEALSRTWETPFTDVPEWAKPYVGYAYANGLTSGTGPATFGSQSKASETQYITFVLRALGYSDDENDPERDFTWNAAKILSNQLGITYGENDPEFLRGDVVEISYYALKTKTKGSDDRLIDILYKNKAVATTEIAPVERVKMSADGTKIYLPDEAAEGVSYKDLARACGCSEDLNYIVDPKTEADHINNTKYCMLTGNWSYVYAVPTTAVTKSWGNCDRSVFGESEIYGGQQYGTLFGVFENYWAEFYYDNGKYYVYSYLADPVMTPQLIRQYLIDSYKIIEAKHNEFYGSGKLNESSTDLEIAKAYADWLVEWCKGASPTDSISDTKNAVQQTAYGCLKLNAANCVGRAAAASMAWNYEGIRSYTINNGFTEGEYTGHILAWAVIDGKEYMCEPEGSFGLSEVMADGAAMNSSGPSGTTGEYLSPYMIAMARKEMGLSYDAKFDITNPAVQDALPKFTGRVSEVPFSVSYQYTTEDGSEWYLVKVDESYTGKEAASYQVWLETKIRGAASTISNLNDLAKMKEGLMVRLEKDRKVRCTVMGNTEFTVHER